MIDIDTASLKGTRAEPTTNEDIIVGHEEFYDWNNDYSELRPAWVVAVADGFSKKKESGKDLADFSAARLVTNFPNLYRMSEDPLQTLRSIFCDLDEQTREQSAGTTLAAVAFLPITEKVFVAVLGDSIVSVKNPNNFFILPNKYAGKSGKDLWGCLGDKENREHHEQKPETASLSFSQSTTICIVTDGAVPLPDDLTIDEKASATKERMRIYHRMIEEGTTAHGIASFAQDGLSSEDDISVVIIKNK